MVGLAQIVDNMEEIWDKGWTTWDTVLAFFRSAIKLQSIFPSRTSVTQRFVKDSSMHFSVIRLLRVENNSFYSDCDVRFLMPVFHRFWHFINKQKTCVKK